MHCNKLLAYNERWDYFIGSEKNKSIAFTAQLFLQAMEEAWKKNKRFRVALSGGSTPKELYASIAAQASNRNWEHVELFWSDERCVPLSHPDSNYKMAMDIAFGKFPIPKEQIHPMQVQKDPQKAGELYHHLLKEKLGSDGLDFTLLGMGEDAHTASLFPQTHALDDHQHLATANFVPKLDSWRLTFTFRTINLSQTIAILCLGEKKQEAVKKVFFEPCCVQKYPIQGVGTPSHKAIWIFDKEAAGKTF